ncbi:MAG TPA: hypothetical protein VFE55_18270 [Acidimicrobiia bacterium]|nr:hypothetical protein [Acidimicrobiia bacterium]
MVDHPPWRRALRIAGAVVVVVVMAAAARDLAGGASAPNSVSSGRNPLTPSPSAPSGSRDPSAPLLAGLVVADSDVAPALTVAGLQGGNGLTQPTLDLCNGTFPSEGMRTARLQVAAVNGQGETVLSTEAVLYSSGAGTTAAFNELRKVSAACPSSPVDSPVGEPTVTTHFGPAPDAGWPQVTSVERLAYSFDVTDTSGETTHQVAVFLRRGRALLGVYFSRPDAPPSVQGRTTLPDIVNLFAARLAKLPVEAVSTTA